MPDVLQEEAERLSTKQVAELTNLSESSIRKMAVKGEIPCMRLSDSKIQFFLSEIREWMQAKRTTVADALAKA